MEMSRPDYANSIEKIYTDAARAAISHDRNLRLLSTVTTSGRMPGAPSWVPNWKTSPIKSVLPTSFYDAAKASEPRFSFSPDGQQLSITGIYIDEIVARERPVTLICIPDLEQDPEKAVEVLRPMRAWYRSFGSKTRRFVQKVNNCLRSREYSPPVSRKEAFFRTITLDGAYDEGDVERFRDAFEWWFTHVIADTKTDLLAAVGSALEELGILAQDMAIFLGRVTANLSGKGYSVTKKGYVGMGMYDLEVGDSLVLFAGTSAPYIVRRTEHGGTGRYTLIGAAYAHGIMYGQAWDEDPGRLEEFALV